MWLYPAIPAARTARGLGRSPLASWPLGRLSWEQQVTERPEAFAKGGVALVEFPFPAVAVAMRGVKDGAWGAPT